MAENGVFLKRDLWYSACMLTIICGEDTAASRTYYFDTLEAARKKGASVTAVTADELGTLSSRTSANLFAESSVFTIENLNKSVARKGSKVSPELLGQISKDQSVTLIDYEHFISSRELKIAKVGTVREFKPSNNVFKLVDACLPGNAKNFLSILHNITDVKNEMFVYLMLQRHIRSVVLSKVSGVPQSASPWQRSKLASAAKRWETARLIEFYRHLLSIDTSLKTGRNVYGIKRSLDILACYYL